jgi:hypothetical protein
MIRGIGIISVACFLLALLPGNAQEAYDRDEYARGHVQFLVLQLDQWSTEFPQQFYAALMRPPVDSTKLSEAAKSAAGELGESIHQLAALSKAKDLLTNAGFRRQLEASLGTSKELNQAMANQRFPAVLQNSWDQIRSTLNNLARVYKLQTLAVLEPPGGGGGRGGRGPAPAAVPGGIVGYVVDFSCAKRGKGMWANPACVEKCVRDGDKVVLVTEEGKVFQISNQDKIAAETYGQIVTITGKTEGDTITVETIKL